MKTNRGVSATVIVVLMILCATIVPMMPSSDAASGKLDIVSVNYGHGAVSYSVETDSPFIYVIVLDEAGNIVYLGPSSDVKQGVASGSFVKALDLGSYFLKVIGDKADVTDTKPFNVYPDVAGIDVSFQKTMVVGDKGSVEYKILPDGARGTVVLTSSNPEIVSVSDDNTILAVSVGVAYITVTVDGEFSGMCCVTVTDKVGSYVDITSVEYFEDKVYFKLTSDCPYVYVMVCDTNGNIVYTASNPTVQNGAVDSSFIKNLVKGLYVLHVQGPVSTIYDDFEFNTETPVSGITVNVPVMTVGIGSGIVPNYTISPWNATVTDVTYESSDSAVVSVENGNKLVAVGPGTAYISIITVDGGYRTSFAVTVSETVGSSLKIKDVSYKEANISFSIDTDCSFVYVLVLDKDNNLVCFGPSRSVVNGHLDSSFVKYLDDGDYVLRVQGESSKVFHTMPFKVDNGTKIPVLDVILDKTFLDVIVGDRFEINVKLLPENATDKTVSWSISDEDVISYDSDGKFTAKSKGTAVLTAKSGDYQAECIVTVDGNGSAASNKDGSVTITTVEKNEFEGGSTEIIKIVDKKDGEVIGTTDIIVINNENTGILTEAKETTDINGNKQSEVKSTIVSGKNDVSKSEIDAALSQAKAASSQMTEGKITVKIEDAGRGSLSISNEAMKAASEADVELSFEDSSIILDKTVIENFSEGRINVSSGNPAKAVGPAIGVSMLVTKEFNLSVGDSDIHELGGTIRLVVDCEIPEGYSADDIRAWYADENGMLTPVNCTWENGKAIIEVSHLSTYVVGVGETNYVAGNATPLTVAVIVGIIGILLCLTYPFLRKD